MHFVSSNDILHEYDVITKFSNLFWKRIWHVIFCKRRRFLNTLLYVIREVVI